MWSSQPAAESAFGEGDIMANFAWQRHKAFFHNCLGGAVAFRHLSTTELCWLQEPWFSSSILKCWLKQILRGFCVLLFLVFCFFFSSRVWQWVRALSLLKQQGFIRILNCNAMAGRVGVAEINVNGLKEKDRVTEYKGRARFFQSDWWTKLQ